MGEHGTHHILSYGKLAAVLGCLLMLTVVTIGVSYVDLGFFNVPVAIGIASTKATLVLLFFMHLKYEGPLIVWSFISAVIFLAIMITFTFWDVAFRY
ncbi:cytochrome C oxidase subunit IV family protein [Desulfosediminicola ganghwensis]|uniref:cytochrome C oxidase subunit IV family protein n=1 Tax=Desulfosediminicola ganghwensis TaxID=2569540 RepID=UPI0010AC9D4B|nr:cytochrome C oxidase subunit IV family protein [Desulfosediminicola ganghwensis]